MARKSDDITLHQVLVFRDLKHDEIEEIESISEEKNFGKNQVICREGAPGDCFYVIKKGRIRIVKTTPMGTERILSRLGPGSFFGEMSIIDGLARSADAIADEPSTLYCIHKNDLDSKLKGNSVAALKIVYAFARTMSYRLRKMNEELVRLFSDPDRTIREIMESEENLMKYLLISGWYYDDADRHS